DGSHDLSVALAKQRMRDLGIVIERMTQLREGRALDDRERIQHHASLVEHGENFGGTGARGNLVAPDLNAWPLAGDTQIQLHRTGVLHHALVPEVRQNAPYTCTLLYL